MREVVGAQRSQGLGRVVTEAGELLTGGAGQQRVVGQNRLTADDAGRGAHPVGRRDARGQIGDRLRQRHTILRRGGAHGSVDAAGAGQHVRSAGARGESAYREQRTVQGRHRAAHQLGQGQRDGGERRHHVAGPVRVGAVPGITLQDHLELVGGGVDEPLAQRHASGRHLGMHVGGHCVPNLTRLEPPGGDDLLGARGVRLLTRLRQRDQPHGQGDALVRQARARPHHRSQGGEMHVVPTGVHRPVHGGVGHPRRLGHRQRVELGPKHHSGAGGRADAPDPPCLGHPLQPHSGRLECALPRQRSGLLLPRHTRGGMQRPAQLPGETQLSPQGLAPRRGQGVVARRYAGQLTGRRLGRSGLRSSIGQVRHRLPNGSAVVRGSGSSVTGGGRPARHSPCR